MQVRKETLPWVQDLILPWLDGEPQPLTDTVPPASIGDPDSHFLTVDGVTLHYKEAGPATPGTPAVLLLHGFNGSVFNWSVRPASILCRRRHGSPSQVALSIHNFSGKLRIRVAARECCRRAVMAPIAEAGCRVVAFDWPPFGLSQRPLAWDGGDSGNPYTLPGTARLAHGLLRALAIDRAVVVGHSMGAVVAMELWKRCAGRALPLRLAGLNPHTMPTCARSHLCYINAGKGLGPRAASAGQLFCESMQPASLE
jgi:pimeloyl-ACP methyl ester carboxylesterase